MKLVENELILEQGMPYMQSDWCSQDQRQALAAIAWSPLFLQVVLLLYIQQSEPLKNTDGQYGQP